MPSDRAFALYRPFLGIAAVMVASATLASGQRNDFVPPRIASADAAANQNPQWPGGGEVLIEVTVTRGGTIAKPAVLRSTPPFSQMMLDAIARWRFLPATALNPKTKNMESVDAPVLIAAVFRPPTLYNTPTVAESPRDIAPASHGVASPASLIPPLVPPNSAPSTGVFGASVLFEVLVDETGKMISARPVIAGSGYDAAAREALSQWRFRPATRDGRPVRAVIYALFGFRMPVPGGPSTAPTPRP